MENIRSIYREEQKVKLFLTLIYSVLKYVDESSPVAAATCTEHLHDRAPLETARN